MRRPLVNPSGIVGSEARVFYNTRDKASPLRLAGRKTASTGAGVTSRDGPRHSADSLPRRTVTMRFRMAYQWAVRSVTATDVNGRHLSELTESDVTVPQRGRHHPLKYFARVRAPMSLTLFIDSSATHPGIIFKTRQGSFAGKPTP